MKHLTQVGAGYVYYTSPSNVAVRILLYYEKGEGIIASIGQIIRMPSGVDLASNEPVSFCAMFNLIYSKSTAKSAACRGTGFTRPNNRTLRLEETQREHPMASFTRKCRTCDGEGRNLVALSTYEACIVCDGLGYVLAPVSLPVKIQVDNRAAVEFVLQIQPSGFVTLRKKGHRITVQTSVQAIFNLARRESAAEAIKDRKPRKVKRGLLSLTKGR